MRSLLSLVLVLASAMSLGQPISTQDRLGFSNAQIVELGHPSWISYFCSPSRYGVGGRVQAEKIYAVALYESLERKLAALPSKEKESWQVCWALPADIAKSAGTLSHDANPNWDGNALAMAEANTAVNRTIIWMLEPRYELQIKAQRDPQVLYRERATILSSLFPDPYSYGRREFVRLGTLITKLEKLIAIRTRIQQGHAREFAIKMVDLASTRRLPA